MRTKISLIQTTLSIAGLTLSGIANAQKPPATQEQALSPEQSVKQFTLPEGFVISHEKDWGTLDPATAKAIAEERSKRHPDFKQPSRKKK